MVASPFVKDDEEIEKTSGTDKNDDKKTDDKKNDEKVEKKCCINPDKLV